ncbi:MAG: mechanosensitive ion channel family protein [Oscillospiraceae bacterium]|nr:mechanosensitive ion channel family protein [Oscillospiraceae bacterium]
MKIKHFIDAYGEKIIISLIIFIIGFFVIKFLNKALKKAIEKSKLDKTISVFLISILKIMLYIILFIIIFSNLGADLNSLVAVLGVIGLAISLAVKDTLANLSGGMLILFSKPFNIGDYIEVEKVEGVVDSISVLHTKLHTYDRKTIYIPNGIVSNQAITNHSEEKIRRLDLSIGIGYDDDYNKAKEILKDMIKKSDISIIDPEPLINISEFSDSCITLSIKVWVKLDDYFDLKFYIYDQIKFNFDKEGITIPYNKLDVNIIKKRED